MQRKSNDLPVNFPAFDFKNRKIKQLILMLDLDRFEIHNLALQVGVDLMEQVCDNVPTFQLTPEQEGMIFFSIRWYAEHIKQARKLIQEIGLEKYIENCVKQDYESFRQSRIAAGHDDPTTESVIIKMQRIAENGRKNAQLNRN